MNKKEIADAIYKKLDIKQFEAYAFIDLLLEVLTDNLAAGKKIVIVNFGTFIVVERRAKRVVEPNSNIAMIIPARKIVKFVPSQKLKKLIRK